MQLIGDLKLEEILDGEDIENPTVDAGFEERVFVLGKSHVVQPSKHPLVVKIAFQVRTVCILGDKKIFFYNYYIATINAFSLYALIEVYF